MSLRLWGVCGLLLLSTQLFAEPRSFAGRSDGPVVVVVSGSSGPVRLLHEGTVIREVSSDWEFEAAVVLAGPLDAVEWDGAKATVVPGGSDPARAARRALEGRSAPHLFLIKPDGSVEVEAVPEDEDEDEADGETAATAEE